MGRGGAASVLSVCKVRQSSCTRTHERQSTRTREHQSTRASERAECCQSWSGKPPPCPVGGCEGATVSTTRCAGPVERDLRILGGRCVKDAAARHHRGASTVAEVAMPSRGTDATRRRTEARNVAPRVILELRRRVDHLDCFVAPVGRSIASIALFGVLTVRAIGRVARSPDCSSIGPHVVGIMVVPEHLLPDRVFHHQHSCNPSADLVC